MQTAIARRKRSSQRSQTPILARVHTSVRNILRGSHVQPRLKIGAANDPAERAADRVADQVMRMPSPGPEPGYDALSPAGNAIQRMCAGCEEELQRKPMEEEELEVQRMTADGGAELDEEELVQPKEAPGATPVLSAASESAIRGLRGGGSPLPASERAFFEPRFGQDFSGVRVHSGPAAHDAASSINARSFTLGSDIAFAGGEYAPGTASGRRLMAHELAHVGQQNGRGGVRQNRALPPIATVQQIAGQSHGTIQRQEAIPEGRPPLSSPKLARLLGHTDLSGFGHNRSELTKVHRVELTSYSRTILNLLQDYPTGVVTITGHCDASGGPERNDPLGLARAEAAKAFLVAAGVDAERIGTSTRGENDLRVQTRRKEPRNRRVEIRFNPTPMSLGMRDIEKPRTDPKIPNLILPPDYVLPIEPSPIKQPPIKQPPPCPFLGPDTDKRPKVKLSYGFPLTLEIIINPQAPVSTEAKLGELFTKHGLRLTDAELKALTEGRSEGVGKLETIIRNMAPSLGPGCARALAEKIADGLMSESLGGQLGREHRGTEERLAEQEERMREVIGTPDRGPDIQGGVKLIIHF